MEPPKNIIVSIDLAAKPSNPTGWTLLKGLVLSAQPLFTDDEIIEKTLEQNPSSQLSMHL